MLSEISKEVASTFWGKEKENGSQGWGLPGILPEVSWACSADAGHSEISGPRPLETTCFPFPGIHQK